VEGILGAGLAGIVDAEVFVGGGLTGIFNGPTSPG